MAVSPTYSDRNRQTGQQQLHRLPEPFAMGVKETLSAPGASGKPPTNEAPPIQDNAAGECYGAGHSQAPKSPLRFPVHQHCFSPRCPFGRSHGNSFPFGHPHFDAVPTCRVPVQKRKAAPTRERPNGFQRLTSSRSKAETRTDAAATVPRPPHASACRR